MIGRCKIFLEDRQFGFLDYSSNGELFDSSIFFSGESSGVRSGDLAEFDVGTDFEGRPKAFNVQRISRDVAPTIARVWRGRVRFFRPEDYWGLINVSNESEKRRIFFHGSEVQPADDAFWYEPVRGCAVEFSIAKRKEKECAVDVRIVEWPTREQTIEEYFESAPELPINLPTPVAAQSSVLSQATRTLTLLEIRQRRRTSVPLPA